MDTQSPTLFAAETLGSMPYQWQAEVMEAVALQELGNQPPAALAAANGSGKTADVIAPLILWFLARFPKGQVVVTSGSFRQVEKQLWPALRRHQAKFPSWTFLSTEVKTPQGGFALGFSTDDPGRAEGWHGKLDGDNPVFIIVDEAKTVPDGVFEAFDRCTRTFQLWASSPGKPWGQFYDAFHSMRSHYWSRCVKSTECPHIDPAKRERDLEKYGADHPVFRSMHEAEFTESDSLGVVSMEDLRLCIENPPRHMGAQEVAFSDFAAGGDENVIAHRTGNRVVIEDAWREVDTIQASRQFFRKLKGQLGLSGSQCFGDASGMGHVMLDAIKDQGLNMRRVFNQTAAEDTAYENTGAEIWWHASRLIKARKVIIPDDPEFLRQAVNRQITWSKTGKLAMERKELMKARGAPSPDRADAVFGAIYCGPHLSGAVTRTVNRDVVSSRSPFRSGHVKL